MSGNRVTVDVGYEGTPIGNAMTMLGKPADVLDVTRHYEQYDHDFDLQKSLGITNLRYSLNWSKVWLTKSEFDFSFYYPILEAMRERDFIPTIDLCHHRTAYQIDRSYTHPNFPEILTNYAVAVKKNFPWLKKFVLINEPAVTAYFHSNGIWGNYPWHRVYLNMAKAIVLASHALLAIDPEVEFYSPEPIDHDIAADSKDKGIFDWVNFLTQWGRFGMDELLCGKVGPGHGFYKYLMQKGATESELDWFQNHHVVSYFRDLDFYQHNFKIHFRKNGRREETTNPNPPTLAQVICEYRERMPEMRFSIAETNVRGTIRDRITWFRWVLEQCQEAGINRLTWWGLTDADTWGDGNYTNRMNLIGAAPDPVGIFGLKDDPKFGRLWQRQPNEFSDIVTSYVKGQISIEDIPAYEFSGEYRNELQGYAKHMSHMNLRPDYKITQSRHFHSASAMVSG